MFAARVLRPAGLYLVVSMSLEYPKPHPTAPNIYENSLLSEAVFSAFEPSAPPVPLRVPAPGTRQHPEAMLLPTAPAEDATYTAANPEEGGSSPDFHVFFLRHNPRPNESTLALRQ